MPFEVRKWYKRRVSHFRPLNADALLKLRLRDCCRQQVLHSLRGHAKFALSEVRLRDRVRCALLCRLRRGPYQRSFYEHLRRYRG